MNSTLRTAALAMALAAAACGEATPVGHRPGDPSQQQQALVGFQSCTELETYIKDTAVLQMREQLDGNGYWWGRYGGMEDGNAVPAADGSSKSTAAPDHSETNTQVAGVDEADFVKTDGNRVFYLVGRRLLVLKSWPAAATAISSTTQVEGYPSEMFLSEADHALVVFSSVPAWTYDPSVPSPADTMTWDYWYWYADATKVTVFDVSTDTPVVKNEYYLGGWYVSSRRIGSVVRMVASGALRWPELRWWLDTWDYNDPVKNEMALEQLKTENEIRIRAQPLSQWLPKSFVVVNGQKVDVSADCTRFHKPTVGARLGLATVSTFDLANPGNLDTDAVVSEVGQIYANTESLYIATPQWWWGWWFNGGAQDERTWLHKFSLADPSKVAYQGSGSVPGSILDQFSLDEHQGFLRVATSKTTWDQNWQNMQTDNRVYVLSMMNGELTPVGATPPLGEPGERIYSSRFHGDKGFVVTYRQVDPLFTLDLSDPANPAVLGALHIPGYSSYIHLLDESHLLTIGEETETDPATGRTTRAGLKLEVYDVGDLANPLAGAKVVVGTHYGYSEAMWDHKAFNYFAKTGMLAIPFTDWVPCNSSSGAACDYWGSFVSQLRLFHVDASFGVTAMGAIDHKDVYQGWNQTEWYWWYEPYIRRSVQIENFVYSFSYAGVKVNDIAQPSVPVASVAIPPEARGAY